MASVKIPDEYIEGFPPKRLPPIINNPTYRPIWPAHKCLSTNASTVKNLLGGRQHGYLVLTMSPAHCTNFSRTAFVVPANTGLTPMYHEQETLSAIATLKARQDKQLCQWALKNQLIAESTPHTYKESRIQLHIFTMSRSSRCWSTSTITMAK